MFYVLPVLLSSVLLGAAETPDVLVVCPRGMQAALAPWVQWRTAQGHAIAMVEPPATAAALQEEIRRRAADGRLRYVLLVGDAPRGAPGGPAATDDRPANCVPIAYVPAVVNARFGSEPTIASDLPYADLTGDAAPELCVGRLTADTPEALRGMVEKILAYERNDDFGLWRRRLHCVAGVGDFGPLADAVIESTARSLLSQHVPAEYELTMTYGNWRSPYCPDPQRIGETTLASLDRGAWFWVYVGHGYHLELARLRLPGGEYSVLRKDDLARLRAPRGAPIALMLSCYAGALDAGDDCLAEEMLRQPGGPVAVVAGSRVTMPYAMSLLAISLMREAFVDRPPTLGELVRRAKCQLVAAAAATDDRAKIDAIAAAISPNREQLDVERREHAAMFNLFGDPLLRLRYPQPLSLTVDPIDPASAATRTLTVRGQSPIAGKATIELALPRGRLAFALPRRDAPPATAAEGQAWQATYEAANDGRWAQAEQELAAGAFACSLSIPAAAKGPCVVRVFVEGQDACAAGAIDVRLPSAATPAETARHQ